MSLRKVSPKKQFIEKEKATFSIMTGFFTNAALFAISTT